MAESKVMEGVTEPDINVDALKSDIRKAIISTKANSCPMTIRLAWHASGTFDASDGTGGSDGATMRFEPESSDGANAGLSIMRDILKPIKKAHPGLSNADVWTLGGAAAVEFLGGPQIKHSLGRTDAVDASACPANGRLPDAAQGAAHLRDVFYRQGFNDKEIVALSGAHTLGRCHLSRSGFDGPWTRNPLHFDNSYFTNLLEEDWVETKTGVGNVQFADKATGELMMLPTDIALINDESFKPHVELYARDSAVFFTDFAAAFSKLLANGCPAAAAKAHSPSEQATNSFLMYAMHGSEPFVRKFAPDADVNGVERGSQRTALHKAAYWGHIDIVKFLITELGVKVNAVDIDGDTALHDAARFGHTEIVQFILSNAGDAELLNKAGKTAMDVAAERENSRLEGESR